MKRRVWAWPVGIIANVLLFFVYINAILGSEEGARTPLFGQSGRQIFFILDQRLRLVPLARAPAGAGRRQAPAITPRWATMTERAALVGVWLVGLVIVQQLFATLGAGSPNPFSAAGGTTGATPGSSSGRSLATYAMARGWNEFWLCWIGVDLVGVPLLLRSNYIPTAVLYAFYAVFVIYGFVVWLRASRAEVDPGVQGRDVEPAAAS